MKSEQPQQQDGLYFLNLELENFKNIDKKIIDIGGKSILVIGKNGAGKSTIIQALTSALDAKMMPSEPIKQGEERAKLKVVLGGVIGNEKKEYIIDIFFTPANKRGRMVVTNEKGESVKTPATFIKSLIGAVSFDITKWLNDPKDKKLNTLKKLTGKAEEIDKITVQINEKKEALKYKKQRATELEATLKNHGYSREDIDKYSTKVDTTALSQQISESEKAINTYDDIKSKTGVFNGSVAAAEKIIEASRAEIIRIEGLIRAENEKIALSVEDRTKNEENAKKGQAWLDRTSRPDISALVAKMNEATKHNEHFNKISVHADQQKEMLKHKQETEKVVQEVKDLDNDRSKIIATSQLPVKGITFSEDEIFLDGIPLEDGQVNTAKLFEVGAEIAMAMNPMLKNIFLHDASLFDKNSLKAIIKKIEDRGYRVIAEVVDQEGGDLHIEFVEHDA